MNPAKRLLAECGWCLVSCAEFHIHVLDAIVALGSSLLSALHARRCCGLKR